MSLYCVTIGNRQYQIRVGKNQITLNGEPVNVNLVPLNGNGLHLLRRGNQATELHMHSTDPTTYEVLVGGQRVVAKVEEACRKTRQTAEVVHAGELTAPMPGLVVDVLVKEGDTVETGQVLAVLESMKMQMQLRSAIDGEIQVIKVKSGDQVDKGSLLIKVE